MGIESTEFITREQAIYKIKDYLRIKAERNGGEPLEKMSDEELDRVLHQLKYELEVDIFSNYIITDDERELNRSRYY